MTESCQQIQLPPLSSLMSSSASGMRHRQQQQRHVLPLPNIREHDHQPVSIYLVTYVHCYLANLSFSFEYSALSSFSMTIHVPLPSIIEFHNHLLQQRRFNVLLLSLFTCTHTTAATHTHK